MGHSDFLYTSFLKRLHFEPTPCQDGLLRKMADFICSDDGDILVVNGYAGTGKTTAIASVIGTLRELKTKCVLLAPTGRAAKVLSSYAHQPAYTIHKHIYRQRAVGGDGFGEFSLAPNKDKDTLFVVDEVSLIGIDSSSQQSTAAFGSGNLLEDLVRFVRNGTGCKVVLIGDSAQLPPVGLDMSPALSREYMSMIGGVEFVSLTTVVRQNQESGILYNATLVRNLISEMECGIDAIPRDELGLETARFDDIRRIGGGELIETISDAYSRWGEDEVVVLCRSNKRAIKYNLGIRSTVQFKEERLVRGEKLMIVKNCYQFIEGIEGMDYIANGDIANLVRISKYEQRYGLNFAEARLSFPDYDDQEIVAKVILDTLESESASLTYEQSNQLYLGVNEDYSHITSKKKRYDAVREDKYYNALQLKYAEALTCHKSQGGQWECVFIDNAFWQEELTLDDLKWLYTALTRARTKVFLVNFKDEMFDN
ncbi:MAG: AAA family ATPase [Bacteroidales bacterium]|nr:AAA family ATPase [Bacteroidales bacterium]